MASSNTLKDQILALFPDNNNREISALDMRTFVDAVFDSKEELVIKVPTAADIKIQKLKIFEKSIVIIEEETANNGVYVSNVNNPISINQLTKIADTFIGSPGSGNLLSNGSVPMDLAYSPNNLQDIATKQYVIDSVASAASGNPFPVDTYENFLFDFNVSKNSNEAEYFYTVEENIDSINIRNDSTIFYTVSFTYLNGDIETKKIEKISNGYYCTITFNYVNGNINNKQHELVIV